MSFKIYQTAVAHKALYQENLFEECRTELKHVDKSCNEEMEKPHLLTLNGTQGYKTYCK